THDVGGWRAHQAQPTLVDCARRGNELPGFQIKVVRGYAGTPQLNLAIKRGEVQGRGGFGWASVKAETPHFVGRHRRRRRDRRHFSWLPVEFAPARTSSAPPGPRPPPHPRPPPPPQ